MSLTRLGFVVNQGRLETREQSVLPGHKKDRKQTEKSNLLDGRRDR